MPGSGNNLIDKVIRRKLKEIMNISPSNLFD